VQFGLLPLEIILLLAFVQGLCWALARGLGVRLEARAAAFSFVLTLVFLSPFLRRDVLLAPTGVIAGVLPLQGLPPVRFTHLIQSDTLYQFVPWELEVRHALREHRLPLWSDRLDGGSSLWTNPVAGVLSPLAMLARALPIQDFLLALLALKMLLACEGAWALARQVGISRASSLLAAAGFTLGGGMMSWALFPHTIVLAWVPWLTLGCIRLFRWPRARTVATSAAITGAMLLSGHPETAAAGGLLAAVCGCGLRRRGRDLSGDQGPVQGHGPVRGRELLRGSAGFVRGLGAAAAAALLGFALAAPHVLPFLSALPGAARTRDMLAQKAPEHHARLLEPASWFLAPSAAFLRAPINPRVYGLPYQEPFRGPFDWVDALSGYTGLVAFAGAAVVLASASWRRSRRGTSGRMVAVTVQHSRAGSPAAAALLAGRSPGRAAEDTPSPLLRGDFVPGRINLRRVCPWLGFVIVSLLLSAGFVPFILLLQAVPLLRLPAYTRLLPVACLALAVAGGYGTDLLLRRRLPGGARVRVAIGLGLAAAVSLAADRSPYVLLLWGLLVAVALLAPWRRQVAVVVLALALGLDLVPWAQRLLPRGQPALFYPPNELMAAVARETAAGAAAQSGGPGAAAAGAGETGGPWRAVGIARLVYPSLLPVYGIAEVRPDNVLVPAAYLRVLDAAFGFNPDLLNYYASFGHPDHPLLSFLGVRAVVGNIWEPRPSTLVPVPAPGAMPFLVFRNPRALPRWFVPAAIDAIERPALDRWIAGLADPGRVAVFRDELRAAGLGVGAGAEFGVSGFGVTRFGSAAGGVQAAPKPSGAIQAAARPAGTVVAARVLTAVPGRTLLAVPGAGARLLATSIQGPAGWLARAAGGRQLAELTVNGAFLGVVVPANVTRVGLVYRPPGLVAGAMLGLLALLVVLALAAVGGRSAKARRRPAVRRDVVGAAERLPGS
jgi:hypothetical protein